MSKKMIVKKPLAEDSTEEKFELIEADEDNQSRATSFTGSEIVEAELPPVNWIIEGLMPQGVAILGGIPKIGKSLLALNASVAVATGCALFNSFHAPQGEVLYLALEDTDVGIQSRLKAQSIDTESLNNLRFELEWPKFDDDGKECLVRYASDHPKLRLIVIDTYELFRAERSGTGSRQYSEDYAQVRAIREIAMEFKIGILLVHHLTKAKQKDIMQSFSGSTGLTGAADSLYALQRSRGATRGELTITGKYVLESELAIEFEVKTMTWNLLGQAKNFRLSPEKQQVIDAIKSQSSPMSPTQLANKIGKERTAVQHLVKALTRDGFLRSATHGVYEIAEKPEE